MKKRSHLSKKWLSVVLASAAVLAIAGWSVVQAAKPALREQVEYQQNQQPPAPEPVKKEKLTPTALLDELNKRRVEHGLSALTLDERLNASAQEKCDEMMAQQYYAHANPITGTQGYEIALKHMGERINGRHGKYAENLGVYHEGETAQRQFDVTFKSDAHKTIALDSQFSHVGFGICSAYIVDHYYGPI